MSGSTLDTTLRARNNGLCELCGSADQLAPLAVAPARDAGPDDHILACAVCQTQIDSQTDLDTNHWFCLQDAAWSGVPAVQAVCWRLLNRLGSEGWAQNLLEQIYLDEETLAWAQAGSDETDDNTASVKSVDCNGAELVAGDAVTLTKDLDVKGTSFVAKRGTMVKGIRLTDNPELIEGRVNKVLIVIKTCFLKKA